MIAVPVFRRLPAIHAVWAFAAVPIGSASRTVGLAVNPSSDIDTSSTILLIASFLGTVGTAVRRHHEIVGAGPAVSTSLRTNS
jgi:hypothetical protein